MAFAVSHPKVTYYCPKPTLKRNLPQEKSKALEERLIKLIPPKPIDPSMPGDEQRFKYENLDYRTQREYLLKLKSENDDLAHAVDMALHPKKRQKAIKMYQIMNKNTPEAQALQEKIKASRKKIAPNRT